MTRTQFRAFVRVDHPDHGAAGAYWNFLAPWRRSRHEAEKDVENYKTTSIEQRRFPRPTKIAERDTELFNGATQGDRR